VDKIDIVNSDMNFGIYAIKNKINELMYIGQTKRNFKIRRNEHIRKLNDGIHCNKLLNKDWKLYGENNFDFLILHIADELDILDELEVYYIKKYNSFNLGYNDDLPHLYCYDAMKKLKSRWTRIQNEPNMIYEIKRLSTDYPYIEFRKIDLIEEYKEYGEKMKSTIMRVNEIDTRKYYEISNKDFLKIGDVKGDKICCSINKLKITNY